MDSRSVKRRKAAKVQAERDLLKAQAAEDEAWERGPADGMAATERRFELELQLGRAQRQVIA